jgi:hypothetical protein
VGFNFYNSGDTPVGKYDLTALSKPLVFGVGTLSKAFIVF